MNYQGRAGVVLLSKRGWKWVSGEESYSGWEHPHFSCGRCNRTECRYRTIRVHARRSGGGIGLPACEHCRLSKLSCSSANKHRKRHYHWRYSNKLKKMCWVGSEVEPDTTKRLQRRVMVMEGGEVLAAPAGGRGRRRSFSTSGPSRKAPNISKPRPSHLPTGDESLEEQYDKDESDHDGSEDGNADDEDPDEDVEIGRPDSNVSDEIPDHLGFDSDTMEDNLIFADRDNHLDTEDDDGSDHEPIRNLLKESVAKATRRPPIQSEADQVHSSASLVRDPVSSASDGRSKTSVSPVTHITTPAPNSTAANASIIASSTSTPATGSTGTTSSIVTTVMTTPASASIITAASAVPAFPTESQPTTIDPASTSAVKDSSAAASTPLPACVSSTTSKTPTRLNPPVYTQREKADMVHLLSSIAVPHMRADFAKEALELLAELGNLDESEAVV